MGKSVLLNGKHAEGREMASCCSDKDTKSCCNDSDAKSCMKGDKDKSGCCGDSCGKDKTAAKCGTDKSKDCQKACCSKETGKAVNRCSRGGMNS